MDKESRTLIMTLTSEVRLSNKTLFFSIGHWFTLVRGTSSENITYVILFLKTHCGCSFLPYLLKFCWVSRKFFKTVSLPMTPISGMFGLLWDLIFHGNTTRRGFYYRRGSLPRRGLLPSRGSLTSTGTYEHQGLMGLSSSSERKLRGICASGVSVLGLVPQFEA